ncbi:Protein DENND6B, partial [Geodia barretti]
PYTLKRLLHILCPNSVHVYRRFLSSPNFISWFSVRKEEANQKLRLIHLDQLCKADIGFWMRDKQEVEIVDFLLQVKECLVCELFNSHPSVITHSIPPLHSFHLPLHPSSQGPPGSIPQCQLRQSTLSSHRSELSFPLYLRTCSPVLNPLSLL